MTGTPRTEQYRYYALFVQDDWKLGTRATLNVGLRWDYQPPVTVKDDLTVSGFDFNATNPLQSQLPQGAATINPATGQPLILNGGLLFAEPRRSEIAVQVRLEQHPAAHRLHLQVNDWLGRAHQLRPLVPGTLERRPGRRLHDRLPADDAVHRVAPNGVDPGTPWATPFPDGFLQPLGRRAGTADGARHRPADPESRLRDSLHRSVDGRRRRPAAVEHRPRRRLRRQQGEQARRHAQRQLVPKSENDKAIPSLGGNTGYLNVTFPNPFAGLVPGQGINAATVSRGQAAAAVSALHRLLDEPPESRAPSYYNALEAVATRRYSNGVMFAVNYTWRSSRTRSTSSPTTTRAVPRSSGRPAAPSPGHHDADRSAVRSGQAIRRQHERTGRRPDRRLAVQHHRRDPVGASAGAEHQRHPARSRTSRCPRRAVVRALVRQQQHGAQQPAARRHVRLERARHERLPRRQVRFHDVNEPTEPQWSMSLFKNTQRRRRQHAAPAGGVQRVQRPRLRRPEHEPHERQLRRRRHGEPGELPADPAARRALRFLTPRPAPGCQLPLAAGPLVNPGPSSPVIRSGCNSQISK